MAEISPLDFHPFSLLAGLALSFFVWTKWWLYSKKERAALSLQLDGMANPSKVIIGQTVNEPSEIPFDFALQNSGGAQAKNWRIWLRCLDADAFVQFDNKSAYPSEVFQDSLTRKMETLVNSEGLMDPVPPQQSCKIEGVAKLIINEKPEKVTIEYILNSDGMPTHTGNIRFQIDWVGKVNSMTMDEATTNEGKFWPYPLSIDPEDTN